VTISRIGGNAARTTGQVEVDFSVLVGHGPMVKIDVTVKSWGHDWAIDGPQVGHETFLNLEETIGLFWARSLE